MLNTLRQLLRAGARLFGHTNSGLAHIPELLKLLASEDPAVSAAARTALDDLCYPHHPLGVYSREDSDRIDSAHRATLYQRGVTELMMGELRSDVPQVAIYAAQILGVARHMPAVQPLITLLASPNADLRIVAAQLLGSPFGHRDHTDHLASLLRDTDSRVRSAAAHSLGMSSDERAVSHLMRLAESRCPEDRASAICALGNIRAQQALPRVRDALRDRDRRVRRSAKSALASYDLARRNRR